VFSGLLEQMVERIDGAEAAAIMGMDGIIVQRASASQAIDLDLIAAEYTSLLRNALRTSRDTGLGGLQELLVLAERATLMIKVLTPDYFVLLAIAPDGNLGRARYELRKAQLMLEPEFAA
jgi:predicted regulator of Ras-like GTPase activity (Roadblock/LC7/MglB family)